MFFGINFISIQFVLFWFILSLINSGLAQSKNKDGLTWFILSAVLGPVATLIIVMSKKSSDD